MHTVGIVRLDLSDQEALSRSAGPSEPSPGSPGFPRVGALPPNVNRRILGPDVVDALRETAVDHGIDDLHLRVVTHLLPWDGNLAPVPLHFALAFRHRHLAVTGPAFISVLAAAGTVLPPEAWRLPWAAKLREVRDPLPPQERRALLEHYLREYVSGTAGATDLTVICVPSQRPDERAASPTHRAFAALAYGAIVPVGSWDGYILAHGGRRPVSGPAEDPDLLRKLEALLSEWGRWSRTVHEATPDEQKLSGYRRLVAVVDRLREDWRLRSRTRSGGRDGDRLSGRRLGGLVQDLDHPLQ